MTFRSLIALLALTTTAIDLEAGPLRRRSQPTYQPAYQSPSYQQPATVTPVEYTSQYTPAAGTVGAAIVESAAAGDGVDGVNAKRAARGLRPFVRDEGLTQAAFACASARAQQGLFGHTANDFAFVPPGSSASSAGCAAYPASYGWMSCCVYDNYTYGGAAAVTGADGRRYMHLFVR